MLRILIVSIFAAALLAAGCKSDRANRRHEGCHTVGSHRVGRNSGSVHHHYAKPPAPLETSDRPR